ncbi:MAG: AMP-binding protein [Halieaceae bacterium]|jgi:long-subunit acyl-CoA synthetase (AMP-forming)|nr:AMP-binding protein [Halieaceae bacterium]
MTETPIENVLDAAYEWERNHPDRVYMTQPVGNGEVIDYTWSETMQQARKMAAYLRSLNLPANSHIALISKNCAHFIMCDLAIWMAGHATVALYPTLNADTVAYILEHSDSRLVFIGKLDDWEDMAPGIPAELPGIALPLAPQTRYQRWDDIIARCEPISDSPSPPPGQLALICYTSGSTGRPKGVMHSFGSISVPGQHFGRELEINSSDRVLSYLPLAHVMERAVVECSSFYSGMHIFFADRLDTFVEDLRRARPTVFLSVPRLWLKFQLGVLQKFPEKKLERLLKIPVVAGIVRRKILQGLGLENVRIAGSGSAPIPAELIEWYDKLGLHIIEGYGMSEDFSYSHMSTPNKRRPGYVGVAWSDVKTRISPEGEIQIISPGNMLGYYKEPELTAACYTDDGYFKTGDRGKYSSDGLLRITGRVKELFKTSKGKYVAPVPIENLLNSDRHIELSCVSGPGRPACFALVQLAEEMRGRLADPGFRDSLTPRLEALLDEINNKVEGYEELQFLAVVREDWQIANDFLTPTLKIKRNVIEQAYAQHLDQWYESRQKVIWQ